MSSQWYITRDGKSKVGPYSSHQLRSFAKSGQLLHTDMVWKEGMAKWKKASEVKGLVFVGFPTLVQLPPLAVPASALQPAPTKPEPNLCANCGKHYTSPVAFCPHCGAASDVSKQAPTKSFWKPPVNHIVSVVGGLALFLCCMWLSNVLKTINPEKAGTGKPMAPDLTSKSPMPEFERKVMLNAAKPNSQIVVLTWNTYNFYFPATLFTEMEKIAFTKSKYLRWSITDAITEKGVEFYWPYEPGPALRLWSGSFTKDGKKVKTLHLSYYDGFGRLDDILEYDSDEHETKTIYYSIPYDTADKYYVTRETWYDPPGQGRPKEFYYRFSRQLTFYSDGKMHSDFRPSTGITELFYNNGVKAARYSTGMPQGNYARWPANYLIVEFWDDSGGGVSQEVWCTHNFGKGWKERYESYLEGLEKRNEKARKNGQPMFSPGDGTPTIPKPFTK
jgi:hypothetical protein